jgi:hypothetical protein
MLIVVGWEGLLAPELGAALKNFLEQKQKGFGSTYARKNKVKIK